MQVSVPFGVLSNINKKKKCLNIFVKVSVPFGVLSNINRLPEVFQKYYNCFRPLRGFI